MKEQDKLWEQEEKQEELEPREYFNDLKSKMTSSQIDQLEKNRDFIAKEIKKAQRLGQKNLTHKAAFTWETLEKEMVLHAMDIRTYVHRGDVMKLIDNVKPKNSVKIVELENYPRSIPDDNMEDIIKAQELGIFDTLLVLYTDLENEEVNSPAQKEFVARNRDPIVFGMFVNEKINVRYDRMYFITDWEDEFCDLTFDRMIDKMTEMGIESPKKTIENDIDQINGIAEMAKKEVDEIRLANEAPFRVTQKKTFMSKLKDLFK